MIFKIFINKVKITVRNRFLLNILALASTYMFFSIFPCNQWIYSWLKGTPYTAYQSLFCLIIILIMLLYTKHYQSLLIFNYRKTILTGLVVGYFAGLCAYLLMHFFLPYGISKFLHSVKSVEVFLVIFIFPVWLLSWLYGGIMTIISLIILKWSLSSADNVTPNSPK